MAKDRIRERKLKQLKMIEIKRRGLFAKKSRSRKAAATESREGITYQSNCGFSSISDLLGETGPQMDVSNCIVVIFYLETTPLSKSSEIVQIAACCGQNMFNAYIVPSKGMSPGASLVTGLRVTNGEMFLHDRRLDTLLPSMAFAKFLDFLLSLNGSVILVAHNGFRFDAPVIVRHLKQFGLLDGFQEVVKGFSDTLEIFREKLPDRKKEKKKFSQEALALDFLGQDSINGAHNAVSDILLLDKLLNIIGIEINTIKTYARSVNDILRSEMLSAKCLINKASLELLDAVSSGTKTKITKAGIDAEMLKKAYVQDGDEGVRFLLGEDVQGKPRVTKNVKILRSITDQLAVWQNK